MPLFLITGLPGTGKTTTRDELRARGYEAYDADKDHLAWWYNLKTGQVVKREDEARTPEFVRNHSRDIPRQTVEKLAIQGAGKPVFLCGDPANEDELRDLFTNIFALVLDKETIKQRLATRTDNDWGKLPHELGYTFSFWEKAHDNYKKFDYIILDATKPTNSSVDYIIEKIN